MKNTVRRAGAQVMKNLAVSASFLFAFLICPVWFLSADYAWASGHSEAMEAGKSFYRTSDLRFWDPINFVAAREQFLQALTIARTDDEKAEALLAAGNSRLDDFYRETDYGSIRGDFEKAFMLEGAGEEKKAGALLGIGETYLREKHYERARMSFNDAGRISGDANILKRVRFAVARSYMQERKYGKAQRGFENVLGMEGVRDDRGLGFEARALMEGMQLLPRVRLDRPRMFFNSDSWPGVEHRAVSEKNEHFKKMAAGIEAIAVDEVGSPGWRVRPMETRHMEAAFVYRVTGSPEALKKAGRIMRVSLDFLLGRDSPHRARSYPGIALAAALDWIWEDLPPDEREALASDLVRYGYMLQVADRARDILYRAGRLSFNYYEKNVIWYAGLAALHEDMDDLELYRALAVLGRGYLNLRDEFGERALKPAWGDGASRSALEYYLQTEPDVIWPFLYCWESAFDEPVPGKWIDMLSPDYILRNALEFLRASDDGRPRMRHFGYGFSWRHAEGMSIGRLYDHLAHMAHFYGRTRPNQAGIALHLRQRMEEKGLMEEGLFPVYPFLLDFSRAPEPRVPDGMPIARRFEYIGKILMSSGFGPDATYALFSCGENRGTPDYDATHFTIYKKGYMALDSGTRAQGGPDGSMQRGPEYSNQTVAHNCVLIRMPGETLVDLTGRPVLSNSGGQRRLPRPEYTDLLAFESGRFFAYAATDATRTYHEDKCAQMVRQFVFIPPYHFVVFDRVTSKNAEYPKRWLLHTSNEPVIEGNEFHADQNRGRIFCRTLLPADAVLEPVGGPGREFWADGRNWPMHQNSPYFRTIGMESGGEIPESIGRWRVEVSPGAPREEDYFLHLIQVSDQNTLKMADTRLIDDNGAVGVEFSHGERSYALEFNRKGEVGGRIKISRGRRTLVDRALTDEVMQQNGLALTE